MVTEWDDVQALVKTGFGTLREAGYLLLRVTDAAAARAWLAGVRPTSAADGVVAEAVQIALTAAGLRALGVAPDVVAQFGPEFRQGLAADPSRSRRLGDIEHNAPARWTWGHGDREPHVMVMLYAAKGALDALRTRVAAECAPGYAVLAFEATGHMDGREPFGFLDGVSQPVVDWQGARDPAADTGYTHLLAAGEVLLGYPNEYGHFTDRPLLDAAAAPGLPRAADAPERADLGRNGSYLVYRRLAQDVRGFWRWAEANGGLPLAEAMVGRSIDGRALAGLGAREIPGHKPYDLNDFTFYGDVGGVICPVGSHIRRSNPRNADLPCQPSGLIDRLGAILGLTGTPEQDAVSSTRFHRILRRGREYGAWLAPEDAAKPDAPDPQSGLNFICLNASIARQFEFVQGAWIANSRFAGLHGEQDPLLGNRCPLQGATDGFTRPGPDGAPERHTLPAFVTVTAGAYFFLPGLRALRFIAGA